MRLSGFAAGAGVTIFLSLPVPAAAQAFTPPEGVGAVTFSWQVVDNTGHRFTDGFFLARGQSMTMSGLAEVDYGITDRLAGTLGLPYVFAKYTGALPPPSGLPVDACACWHSSFQDFGFAVRYRLGSDTWAVTPSFRYGLPSHAYDYRGEAVVGRRLQEAQVALSTAYRLADLLPKATVHANYTYSFVERALDDVGLNRSGGVLGFGYALTDQLYLTTSAIWQRTHGGLQAGSPTGNPFPLPGELNTPDRLTQRDRLIKANYWQWAGGLAYSIGAFDVFGSFTKYVWGRDAHNGMAYTVGTTYYFDLSR